MSDLALFGAEALVGSEELRQMTSWPPKNWPPKSTDTARKLTDLYFSNDWSFDSTIERKFSESFAHHHSARRGVFMNNGTVTLQCALTALGVGPGDEVLVPPFTWIATAMAVHYTGAIPVFIDVDPDTLCMDPCRIASAVTERTKAIIPVHLYSAIADMDGLLKESAKYNLKVVEDCAHVHGARWGNKGVGSIGDVGSFSFQHTKTMASGEGGICICDDDELADTIFRLSHIGYAPGAIQGKAASGPKLGLTCHNFRATGLQALLLNEQLHGLGDLLATYQSSFDYLEGRLTKTTSIRFQQPGKNTTLRSYFGFVMLFDHESLNDVPLIAIRDALNAEGLMVAGTWDATYDHMLFNLHGDQYRISPEGCPNAEAAIARTLVLLHPFLGLGREYLELACDIIEKVLGNSSALRDSKS